MSRLPFKIMSTEKLKKTNGSGKNGAGKCPVMHGSLLKLENRQYFKTLAK
jgi:hypothetical protein